MWTKEDSFYQYMHYLVFQPSMRGFYTKSRTFKGMNFEQYFKSEFFRSLRLCTMFAEGICQETNELQKREPRAFLVKLISTLYWFQ